MTASDMLDVVVTELEMVRRPPFRIVPNPAAKLALLRAQGPMLSFYRYLYKEVGERWFWWERRAMKDSALKALILNDKVEIYVLYVDGVPAGFAELDYRRHDNERLTDLALLGLMPDFIGKGYGRYLGNWIIEGVWRREPKRLTTRYCSFDHPRAAGMLQRFGFTVVGQRARQIADPRQRGLIAPDLPLPNAHGVTAPRPGPGAVVTPLRRE